MRIKLAHIALIISIIALALSLFTAVQVSSSDDDALIDALMAQNQDLQAQINALTGQTDNAGSAVSGAALTAAAWADGLGADVTLTLEGAEDTEVLLRVMLGSSVITEVPCQWDGAVHTATVSVAANNGYTYSMIIGNEARILASPENPAYPELVYLADALTAYCNLIVGEWYVLDNVLTVESCYAHIQMPQLGGTGALTCTDARLVLKRGDEVLAEVPISPIQAEAPGSLACDVVDAAFVLPELAEGEQVDLWLEATLSDGQILTTSTATWYVMASGFSMAAG